MAHDHLFTKWLAILGEEVGEACKERAAMKTKPCPFCGYNDVKVTLEHGAFGSHAVAKCQICGAEVSGIGVMVGACPPDDLTTSAIDAWNTRSEPRKEAP